MRYLPLNLAIHGRPILVVGGGNVAGRKCRSAIAAGAEVTVVAPELSPQWVALAEGGEVHHWPRPFRTGDTHGFFLVFAATDDPAVNRAVAAEATASNVLVEVVDAPASGNFTSPAVLVRGELMIAVSTGGAAPALARQIRDEIGGCYGREYALVVGILAAVRQKLLTDSPNRAYNKRIFEQLAGSELPRLCRDGALETIDQLLVAIAGSGYTLAQLGLSAKELS